MKAPVTGIAQFLREAQRLGVPVSHETTVRLETFVGMLARWQKAINLVGRGTLEDVWSRHVLDSGQLVAHIPPGATSLTDLGSGGGFPGLVVAILRPDLKVTLIEADARKAAFLGEVSRRMELPILPRVTIGRIEVVPPERADVVTARALAPLGTLLEWACRHRNDTAICLFHRGKGWRVELTETTKNWDINVHPLNSVTDRDAVILRIGPYAPADIRDRQPERRRRQDDDGH